MASLAKITLVGNLGRDSELRYTPSGAALLEFSLATNERWTDSGGRQQEHTQWFRCTLWGRQAESLKQYLLKGKQVYVDGRLRVRDYVTQEGEKRYSLDVRVDQVQMLGGGGTTTGSGGTGELERPDGGVEEDDIPF